MTSPREIGQRARALLAAELFEPYASLIRAGRSMGPARVTEDQALAAIEAALRSTGGEGWEPIESAPKDGTIFFSYWAGIPVFVAWCGPVLCRRERRAGPFWNRRTIPAEYDERGFRVLMPPARNLGWGIHGNFAPFTPKFWRPLPAPGIPT